MLGSLNMGWRHVLFANWPVDPDVVQARLPDALEVDTHDGRAWLSVVPFTNVDVRPKRAPSGVGLPLPELNLRTYVTYEGRPGVYFFSLDAQGVLAVLGARAFHHLPYYYARIALEVVGYRVRFESRRRHPGARPLRFDSTYGPTGDRYHADAGSLEFFLTARDRYYTESPSGELRYAVVEHEPWPLYDATAEIEPDEVFRANGFATPESEPRYLYSPGVETVASESKRLEP
ncbi:YqjF family protein [Natronobacterium texcoconense]|uniref:DUF2071 domain-containing protein n=1 Tax=Natronobacterium texcoconense TaxID=1095778 RepID=A0A1H1HKD6_NATTX|nr:DUF2071 domain-containing protein [Natronobacterium texcoconense]SDR25985.1 hypothetical protein SAMN04489842_2838 [Natronobacterium texcoconense]